MGAKKALLDLKREGWHARLPAIMMVVFIALMPVLFWKMWENNKKWKAFSAAHHCKKVAVIRGDVNVGTGTVISPDGKVGPVTTTTVDDDKTGWLCDDGVTYWR